MPVAVNFTKELLPDDLASEIQKTNKLSLEQYEELINILFNFLTNSSEPMKFEDSLKEFASCHAIKINPLKNMMKTLVIVGNAMVQKNLGIPQIQADLVKLNMSDDHIAVFCEKWKLHITKMHTSLLTTLKHENKLVGFDWKFGVTASSSESQQVGNCFIQLKLTLRNAKKELKTSVVELTLPQFYDFLHEIEKAKISLENMA